MDDRNLLVFCYVSLYTCICIYALYFSYFMMILSFDVRDLGSVIKDLRF